MAFLDILREQKMLRAETHSRMRQDTPMQGVTGRGGVYMSAKCVHNTAHPVH